MNFPPYSEIQAFLRAARTEELPGLTISVLRNIVLEPMVPYLRYLAFQMGFNGQVRFGQYDNVYQEAVGGDGELLTRDLDCVMVFLYLEQLSPKLTSQFAGSSEANIRGDVERIRSYIQDVVQGIRRQTDGLVIWHGFEMPLYPGLGVWDGQTESGQSHVIDTLNEFLRDALHAVPNCYYLDMNHCVARVGGTHFYDARHWYTAKAPYSRFAMQEMACEESKFLRPLKGKNKRCIALDCDNTLWGGIVGEDGLLGIQLSKTYPGASYRAFQQEILNLYHRGVILALCSKNNEADVWEVFEKHPDMVLRKDHIATAQINWQDKATNLRRIAGDLNIGLDSVVFIDDDEFEADFVRQALPEVHVMHLPRTRAADNGTILAACGLFDTLVLSAEDRERGAMYQAEATRKKLKEQAADLESYLRSLEMVLEIRFATSFTIPRIAQLTQKTNQFNLTTRRYNEASIRALVEDGAAEVLVVTLDDKLGDLGLVGVCILRYEQETADIDTLLLSCRALGRGVEDVLIRHILMQAKSHGCCMVAGTYIKTNKSAQVESFYLMHGFNEVSASRDGNERRFHYDFRCGIPAGPGHFKEIRSDVEELPR